MREFFNPLQNDYNTVKKVSEFFLYMLFKYLFDAPYLKEILSLAICFRDVVYTLHQDHRSSWTAHAVQGPRACVLCDGVQEK
jgi:hypothetical protein